VYMFNVHILDLGFIENNMRREIYDNVSDAIPSCLRKDFQYSEHGSLRLPLMPDSDEYSYVIKTAKNIGSFLEIREKTVYTPTEEKNCEFFYMWLSEPMEIEAVHLEDYGTQFRNGCTLCDANRNLIGDALIDRKLVKKKPILQLTDSLIAISKSTKWLIEKSNLTGFEFKHMLKDYKGREMEEYFCIEPTANNILPPMHSQTWFWEWTEKPCEHKQYLIASNVKYSYSSLVNAKDLNFSFEFSYGLNPNRFIIVSKKLRDVFMENKIRAGFMPVNIIKD